MRMNILEKSIYLHIVVIIVYALWFLLSAPTIEQAFFNMKSNERAVIKAKELGYKRIILLVSSKDLKLIYLEPA